MLARVEEKPVTQRDGLFLRPPPTASLGLDKIAAMVGPEGQRDLGAPKTSSKLRPSCTPNFLAQASGG